MGEYRTTTVSTYEYDEGGRKTKETTVTTVIETNEPQPQAKKGETDPDA